MFRKLLLGAAVAGTLAVAAPTAAFADSYLDEATQALQSSDLYVSAQVNNLSADDQSALVSQLQPTDIAIVVLPASASSEITDIPSFISTLASRTGHDTILVSIGGDFSAGSAELPSGVASQLASDAEHSGSLASGLDKFVEEVQQKVPAQQSSTPSGGDGGTGVIIGSLGAVILVLAAAGAGLGLWLRRRNREPVRVSQISREKLAAQIDKFVPQVILEKLEQLANGRYEIKDDEVKESLERLDGHIRQLFVSVHKNLADSIKQITAEYNGTLETVLRVVLVFPELEDKVRSEYFPGDPAENLLMARNSILQYEKGVIDNIRETKKGEYTALRVDSRILARTVPQELPSILQPKPIKKKDQ